MKLGIFILGVHRILTQPFLLAADERLVYSLKVEGCPLDAALATRVLWLFQPLLQPSIAIIRDQFSQITILTVIMNVLVRGFQVQAMKNFDLISK